MELLKNTELSLGRIKNPVLTLGNFDGVHLGHQKIFQQLNKRASQTGGQSVVFTFIPHPVQVLKPQKVLPIITLFEEKVQLIAGLGIDFLVCATFDKAFANLTAAEFVEKVLCDTLGVRSVFVGYDYVFGRGREGDINYLKKIAKQRDFSVEIIDPVFLDGQIVSSSRIRQLVQEGDMPLTTRMLGRNFSVTGTVVEGKRRGKELGFPTANLKLKNDLFPKQGVYATNIELDGKAYKGMTNIGTNPTFKDGVLSIETYIFDFNRDCYGEELKVFFVERLRDEKAFRSPEELIAQLKDDERRSREILDQGSTP
jgi:riboflavin kinase/FMN adenylyltransferase